MSRIKNTFKRLKKQGKTALITFLAAGYPDLSTTESLALELVQRGSDIIELGVPFSEPVADGPIIQAAYQKALEDGVGLKEVLTLVERIRESSQIPLILMSYFKLVREYGLGAFAQRATAAGLDGVIVPDLALEKAGELIGPARKYGLDTIFLISPASPAAGVKKVTRASTGFVYCASTAGVSGGRIEHPNGLRAYLAGVRSYTKKPLAVGFGVETAEQVREISTFADGVVVGSALMRVVAENLGSTPKIVRELGDKTADLARGTRARADSALAALLREGL
ncbi:MAG: tryptophan synthase subunit alpha [Thermodesulfobacteriota bacterium]